MDKNRTFYIRLEDQPDPVLIDTHINPERTAALLIPRTTVGHLISAFFPNIPPNELGKYKLYKPDGTTFFNSYDPLPTTGLDGQSPLIIKSDDTITINEYMAIALPTARYHTTLPAPSSSIPSHPRIPQHVFNWPNFNNLVLEWVRDNYQVNETRRINRPRFVDRVISEEVPQLQPFVFDNLLNVAQPILINCEEFVPWGVVDWSDPQVRGKPDFAVLKHRNLAVIGEVKGKWTLPGSDIVNSNDSHVKGAITQIYTYMCHQHRQYAIITSYDFTWFFYRNNREEYLDDCETLYISPGIPINQTNNSIPHILQCFGYFLSIVNNNDMESPPSSTRSSPRGSVSISNRSGSNTPQRPFGINRSLSFTTAGVPFSNNSGNELVEEEFEVDDFKLKSILGFGRTKVCYEENFGVALKFADVMKSPEMLDELRNEVRIYNILSSLQGICIPRVMLYGHWEGLYCIGFSYNGSSSTSLNSTQKQKIIDTLDSVHELGVLHRDIKKENILIDGDGNPFLIDFGFGTNDFSLEEVKLEKDQLLRCIECL